MFRLISFGGGSSVPFGDVGAEVDQRRTVFGIGIVGEHLHGAGVGLLMVAVGVQPCITSAAKERPPSFSTVERRYSTSSSLS